VGVGLSIAGALGLATFVVVSGKPQSTLYITLGDAHDGAADARTARPLSERLLALTQELAEHADTPSAARPIERELSGIVERLVPLARSARPG